MATDGDESLVDDWVLLNEEDRENKPFLECDKAIESPNADDKEGEDLENCKDDKPDDVGDPPTVLEDEADSFSVLSSSSDNFSYLSWYDNVMEDIIVTAGKRCYTHFRNHKLNKSLDFVLAIAFTLVTGLAIGNFIGLSKNCEYEKYKLIQNCTFNETDVFTAMTPALINKKILDESQHMVSKLIENRLNSRVPNNFALVEFSMEKHSSILEDEDLPHEIVQLAVEEHVYEATKSLLSGSGLNQNSFVETNCNETDNQLFMANKQSGFLSNLQSVRGKDVQNLNPMDMIQYLHSTVDEVVHRAIQLTLNLPTENIRSPDDSAAIEQTKNVIQEFTNLVKDTLNNLSTSVKSVDFKRNRLNNKSFFKTTSGILKSVDKLMKGVFEEALSNKEALKKRLQKIRNICFGVVKKLQKNLRKDEKRNFKPRDKYFKKDDFKKDDDLKKHYAQKESKTEETYKQHNDKESNRNHENVKPKPYFRNRSN